ncbi:MAG: hypothetical protein H7Z21_16400 [Hymenobacter sp.]|nr:hypothetical protein [Hymenobacter sp.]
MPTVSPDLRKALLNLPQREKDHLLVRLVGQDAVLTEQLVFRLLEGEDALEIRRQRLRTQIDDPVRGYHQTPNDLLHIGRQLQARLAYHVRVTGDTLGELELTLRLLTNIFRYQPDLVAHLHGPTQPLLQHLAHRTYDALKQAARLHEDHYADLAPAFDELLRQLYASAAAPLARELGIPPIFGQ